MEDVRILVERCRAASLAGGRISERDAASLFDVPDGAVRILAEAANDITRRAGGGRVDVEQLHNIKMNACSEDCSFCGQSAFFETNVGSYELPPADEILERARRAKADGASSYCLVAAWRQPSGRDFEKVCGIIRRVRSEVGISIECSLGFLTGEQARALKRLGVKRYNHNLETAPSKFPEICTTHTFQDRVETLRTARGPRAWSCVPGG